ncbi:unnamed protein product [Adineta steineri]|uniref:HTH CENPB-type domain-containing protein n=1 Tax=Adineta steineri TaxID=433720 RepID=A0A815MG97_9BILA|nr:unnamed protein product [Adineta steineri]CAF3864031.1 unnamed protein product [Adineta steineri]
MATKRTLTLSDKVKLIHENEQNVNYRTLAENYQISIGSVSNIIKRKAEYLESYVQNENSNKKRNFRDEFNQQLDQKVYEWFVTQRSKNIPISGPLIQEQARQIRQQLDPTNDDFKASNGWLEKFRKRHGIKYKSICGESATVDASIVDEWLSRISSVINKLDLSDVYNADESGLFFKALPNRSLVITKETCKGGKRSKERFTILCCTNMTGTDKLQPLLIGKAAKPRCFKNLNVKQLPVKWRWNRTSWMTATLFDEWLQNLNNTMIKQKRKIQLFIDHAPCHNLDAQYSNITAGFVHPNTQHDTNITTNDINDNDLNNETIADDISTALQNLDTLLTHSNNGKHRLTANEFTEIDSETPAFNEWNDTNDNPIVVDENGIDNITTEDNDDEDMPTEPPPKLTEAMEMIRRLHILAATQQPQLHSLISQLDSQLTQLFIDSKGVKQTTIDDFFHKNK